MKWRWLTQDFQSWAHTPALGWVGMGGVIPGLRTPPLSGNVDKCCHIRTQDLYECSTERSLLFVYEIHTFHQPSFTKIGIALHKQRNWTKVVLILLLMGKDIAKITWVLACFRHMAVKNNSKRKKNQLIPTLENIRMLKSIKGHLKCY